MITLLLIYYFFNGLTVSTIHGAIDFASKPIMCGVGEKFGLFYFMEDPSALPPDCEVFIFTDVAIDSGSSIRCEKERLTKLVDSKRPVILVLSQKYDAWVEALKPESSAAAATAITDYVTANGCAGVLLEGTSPSSPPTDTSTGEALAAFITKLKSKPDFYVGLTLCQDYPNALADAKALNYESLNKLLDFYIINTYRLNEVCNVDVFNGATPVIGTKDRKGMDSMLATLKNTSILVDKSYLIEEIFVVQPEFQLEENIMCCHGSVCNGEEEKVKTWCAPTTKDYFDKAKFIKDNNYGLYVKYLIYDDVQNHCSCDGVFIGFLNMVAGYTGKAHKPCDKFDRKKPAA